MRAPRRRGALRLLLVAALAAGAARAQAQAATDADAATTLLYSPFVSLPTQALVLRANRAALTRQLDPEFVCTSLSGPSCPSGLAVMPALFSRTPAEAAAVTLPAWLHGAEADDAVFAHAATAEDFNALLSSGGEWLVLFYDTSVCGDACPAAATAIRGAAPALASHGVRFLALSCEPGARTARACAQHLVEGLPEVRLYFGSPHVSLRFEHAAVVPKKRKGGADADDDDEAEEDATEEIAAQSVDPRWRADVLQAFFEQSTTPDVRAMLAHARQLLRKSAAAGADAAASAGGEDAADADADGDDDDDDEKEEEEAVLAAAAAAVGGELMRSLARLIARGGAAAAAAEAGGGGDAAELFRAQLQALLQAAATGGNGGGGAAAAAADATAAALAADAGAAPAPAAAGAADDPLLGGPAPRSLPSKTQRLVQFVNSRAAAADVFWLDFAGRERRYARVEPGRAATLASFTSHVWRVRDARAGAPLATVAVRGRVSASEPDVQRVIIL